ncbi:hypothetical protein B7759_06082 (plasmid) [Burkholderia glumae]|nr:hypothetical protein B7759_06082 [Burkholderia glumae]
MCPSVSICSGPGSLFLFSLAPAAPAKNPVRFSLRYPTFSSFLNRNEKSLKYLTLNLGYFLKKVRYHRIPMRKVLQGGHAHVRPPMPFY